MERPADRRIFVSYRRSDAEADAQLLVRELEPLVGSDRLFIDTKHEVGPWTDRLRRELEAAAVVLVVIGPGWLEATDESGRRRLDDPDDWVRQEVRAGLEAGKLVVPVFVRDASPPGRDRLPPDLRMLPDQEGMGLRLQRHAADVGELARRIGFGARTAPTPPALDPFAIPPWLELPSVPDVFRLLDWRTRLATSTGMERDMEVVVDWILGGGARGVEIGILHGPGGSGKSRLGAEIGGRLESRGWHVRWIDRRRVAGSPAPVQGSTLVVVDSPEEYVEALPELLARHPSSGGVTRVLLLSRNPLDWWHEALDQGNLRELATFEAPLRRPEREEARRVFDEVVERVAARYGREAPGLHPAAAEWAESERLPLFVTATAVEAVLGESPRAEASGRQVIRSLARRERDYLDRTGQGTGLGQGVGARIAALAVVGDGLDMDVIERVVGPAPTAGSLDAAILRQPRWDARSRRLQAPRPDVVAASMLYETLSSATRSGQPERWLSAVISANTEGIVQRLERIVDDIGFVHGAEGSSRLQACLCGAAREPETAQALREAVKEYRPSIGVMPVLVEAIRVLLGREVAGDPERAGLLTALASHLVELGRPEDALLPIEEAVALCRRSPDDSLAALAYALRISEKSLDRLGRSVEALLVGREAIDIDQRIVASSSGESRRQAQLELVRAMNALALNLSTDAMGRLDESIDVLRQALEIARGLERPHPDEEAELARLMLNLSTRLATRGGESDHAESDAALEESLRIRQRIHAAHPSRFAHALTFSLVERMGRHWAEGRWSEAASSQGELVELRHRLAVANPSQFATEYLLSLRTLVRVLQKAEPADQDRRLDDLARVALSAELRTLCASGTHGARASSERIDLLVELAACVRSEARKRELAAAALDAMETLLEAESEESDHPVALRPWRFAEWKAIGAGPELGRLVDGTVARRRAEFGQDPRPVTVGAVIRAILARGAFAPPLGLLENGDSELREALACACSGLEVCRGSEAEAARAALLVWSVAVRREGSESVWVEAGDFLARWSSAERLAPLDRATLLQLGTALIDFTHRCYFHAPTGIEAAVESCRRGLEACLHIGSLLGRNMDLGCEVATGARLHLANALDKARRVPEAVQEYSSVVDELRRLERGPLAGVTRARFWLVTAVMNRAIVTLRESMDGRPDAESHRASSDADVREIIHMLEGIQRDRVVPGASTVRELFLSLKVFLGKLGRCGRHDQARRMVELCRPYGDLRQIEAARVRAHISALEVHEGDEAARLVLAHELVNALRAVALDEDDELKACRIATLSSDRRRDIGDYAYALALLGELTGEVRTLDESIALLQALIDVAGSDARLHAALHDSLGLARFVKGRVTSDLESLRLAAVSARIASEGLSDEESYGGLTRVREERIVRAIAELESAAVKT